MKFSISKESIQKAMQHVSSAIDPRGTVPILSYIKVTARDNKIFLVATNLDTEASDSVDCEVAQDGSLAVPTSTVNEIIKKLPSGTVITFDSSDKTGEKANRLILSAGRGKFEVNSLSDSDFPSVFSNDFEHELSMSVKDLLLMIKSTMFAMSNKPERYNLNGLLFHTIADESGENTLCTVATDGHRLSFAKTKIKEAHVIPNRVVPRKSVVELSKILSDYSENSEVKIKFGNNKAVFIVGSLKYVTKLLDTDFPDYNRVVPKNNDKTLEISKDQLLSALARVSIVYKMGGARGVKFSIESDKVILTSSSGFGDIADEDLECSFSEKEKFETSYNPDFIIEALEACDGSKARFSFSDTSAPMLLKSDNENFYHVVMPMRF